jgi:hypothetical protein
MSETLDKIYLELSRITYAKTEREIELEKAIHDIASTQSWEQQSRFADYYSSILSCAKGEVPYIQERFKDIEPSKRRRLRK